MASMQEYLKRYTSDEKKKKKKKKKPKSLLGGALTITDADPVWQREIKEESSESEGAQEEEAPLVIKDVEFKRMQRLEALRMRPYLATAADGSGWVSLTDNKDQGSPGKNMELNEPLKVDNMDGTSESASPGKERDLSPPRRGRHDSPESNLPSQVLSPPRGDSRRGCHDSPEVSPESQDLSPARRELKKSRHDSPERSPRRELRRRGRHDSPESNLPSQDLSPPRRDSRRGRHTSREVSPESQDLSPPRRELKRSRHDSPEADILGTGNGIDLSSPRGDLRSARSQIRDVSRNRGGDLSPPRRHARSIHQDSPDRIPSERGKSLDSSPPRRKQVHAGKEDTDLSPTRKRTTDGSDRRDLPKHKTGEFMGNGTAAGLRTGKELSKETMMKKKQESRRVKELDVSISGRNATTIYRDKHGKRLEGVDEILKLQQAEEPKKEDKPLEWGKGLVQKRQAEAHLAELEAEKLKPFATTREDLDAVLREQIRWGDPMAHLVKKKAAQPVLPDLGANEQMQESGFIIPQDIPAHSWIKRNIVPPPNRYGIKPGRHWDGVDRSTGFEREMYKRQNEKKAEQVEAYLWSVADM